MPEIQGYYVELGREREWDIDITICSQYKTGGFRSVTRVYGEGIMVRIEKEDTTLKTAKLIAAALNAAMVLERQGKDPMAFFENISSPEK